MQQTKSNATASPRRQALAVGLVIGVIVGTVILLGWALTQPAHAADLAGPAARPTVSTYRPALPGAATPAPVATRRYSRIVRVTPTPRYSRFVRPTPLPGCPVSNPICRSMGGQ